MRQDLDDFAPCQMLSHSLSRVRQRHTPSGQLFANRNPSLKRYAQLVAASFCSLLIVQRIPGMAKIDVLFVIAIVLAVWPIARRYPIISLCIGAVQSQTIGLWDGYQPGYLLAIMCTGQQLAHSDFTADKSIAIYISDQLPPPTAWIGRQPITLYLLHLGIITVTLQ